MLMTIAFDGPAGLAFWDSAPLADRVSCKIREVFHGRQPGCREDSIRLLDHWFVFEPRSLSVYVYDMILQYW